MEKTRDLFTKIKDTKGIFHAKMGTIKDKNGMDLTEAEDIKKRWQEYIEELCKKYLHDPDNHDGVNTHLEPDVQWIMEKAREFQKNIYFCFIDYTKDFDCMDHNNLWKILQEMGIPDHLICLLRNLYAGQETTIRTRTWSKLWKEYVKAVYCHAAYLTYMQSTSCKMPGWMKHMLESRLLGEISITADRQMTPLLWQKVKRN